MVCRAVAPTATATKPPSGMPSSHLLFGRAQRRAHQPFLESVIFLTLCSELDFYQPAACRIFISRTGAHDSDQKKTFQSEDSPRTACSLPYHSSTSSRCTRTAPFRGRILFPRASNRARVNEAPNSRISEE